MKVVFTGGGTVGHIFPILAIVRQMRKMYPQENLRLFYLGPKDEYSLMLLKQEEVRVKTILSGKLRRYFSLKNILDLLKIPIGIIQALFWLFFAAPDIVFSKGGYGSFPTTLAARILHIPIFLHESDVAPGLVSKIASKWALEIFTSFEKTEYFPKEKMICVGNPVRIKILKADRQQAREILKLQGEKPLILILGGSQGAQYLNNIILEILPEFLKEFEVIHQAGRGNYQSVRAETMAIIVDKDLRRYYHLYPFLNELQLSSALILSNLIVSRAGSGALFEIAAAGKPVILIPLPKSAQDHQVKNAYQFAQEGGGEVIQQENLKPHFFLERLRYFFSRPDILQQMEKDSQRFSKKKSAFIIANYILEYLAQSTGEIKRIEVE